MAACEKCWADAFRAAMNDPIKDQATYYHEILRERNKNGPICTPKQAAGPYWDEERQCDTREEEIEKIQEKEEGK